jgi:peptidoglycan hydrolase-like protein with peptidoglycan-binding domain
MAPISSPSNSNRPSSASSLSNAGKAPSTSAKPSATPGTLKPGTRGAQVSALQNDLRSKGFNPGRTDGVFGPATEAAVKKFQASQGLKADGVVGAKTRTALTTGSGQTARPQDRFDRQWSVAPSVDGIKKGQVLKEGMQGQSVRRLQELLGLGETDGKFGPQTQRAVAQFQKSAGLKPGTGQEGVVDKTTLDALEKSATASQKGGSKQVGYQGGKPFDVFVTSVGKDVHGNPESLRTDAAKAWESMKAAARRDGVKLELTDAFRTMAVQKQRRAQYGRNAAVPGFSNHQQGISMDINSVASDPAVSKWLRENSHKFGIIQGDKTPGDLAHKKNEHQHFTYRPEAITR